MEPNKKDVYRHADRVFWFSSALLLHWKEESVNSFFKVALGASREAAIACLSHCKWNQDDAISYFFGDYTEATSGTVQESTSPIQTREEKLLPVKNSPEEQLSRLKEEIIKSFRDVVIVASREAAITCLDYCQWNQEDAISYFLGDYTEANPGIALSQADERSSPAETLSLVKESAEMMASRTSSTQLQNWQELPSQSNDELIDSFVEAADGVVTREVATAYLKNCNWDVDKAFSCLLEEEKTTQVQASHGYLKEGETGSTSSSSNADPSETGNVTVAIRGVAASQVDENVRDRAVIEDLGTELSSVPITSTAIELEINLDDGESGTPVWIRVRPDQTVRDIHDGVDAFRPEDKRDYYFKSDTGVEYRDLDTTVHTITSGSRGSTTLQQVYSA